MLADYEPPPIDPGVDEALREFVEKQEGVDAGRELLTHAAASAARPRFVAPALDRFVAALSQ